jgi:integrase
MRERYRLAVYRGKWCIVWHEDGTKRSSTGLAASQENRSAAEIQLADFHANLKRQQSSDAAPKGPVTIDRCLSGYFESHPGVYPRPALLSYFSNKLPHHVDKAMCQEYAEKRAAQGKRPATIRDELGMVHTATKWAKGEGWSVTPVQVWRPAGSPPRDRWLAPAEAKKLLDGARLPHVKLFILMALHTAARAGAILDLTWDRVMPELNRIDFNKPGRVTGKKRRAVVRMSDDLHQALTAAKVRAIAPDTGPVIEYAGRQVKSVKKGFGDACIRAKLTGVTPHVLRHTAATWMAQRGVPLWDIAGMLGNSVRMVEKVYAKHHPDYQQAATDAVTDALRSAPSVQGEPVSGNVPRTKARSGAGRVSKTR